MTSATPPGGGARSGGDDNDSENRKISKDAHEHSSEHQKFRSGNQSRGQSDTERSVVIDVDRSVVSEPRDRGASAALAAADLTAGNASCSAAGNKDHEDGGVDDNNGNMASGFAPSSDAVSTTNSGDTNPGGIEADATNRNTSNTQEESGRNQNSVLSVPGAYRIVPGSALRQGSMTRLQSTSMTSIASLVASDETDDEEGGVEFREEQDVSDSPQNVRSRLDDQRHSEDVGTGIIITDTAVSETANAAVEPVPSTHHRTGIATSATALPGMNSPDGPEHHEVQATMVDDFVVDASPIDDETLTREARERDKAQIKALKLRYVVGGLATIILAVVIGVVVAFSIRGKDGGEEEALAYQGKGGEDQVRAKALQKIVAPLHAEFQDGKDETDGKDEASSPVDRQNALDWLAKDALLLDVAPTSDLARDIAEHSSIIDKIRQRYLLALFYMSTNGPEWYKQFNFLSDQDECNWVRANSQERDDFIKDNVEVKGVVCDRNERVQRLVLWWNNLSGTLPPELSNFHESFFGLNIVGGNISSKIPSSYRKLSKLQMLALSENCLTGTVPEGVLELPSLKILTLYGNVGLTGSLNAMCNGSAYKTEGAFISADCGDCPGSAALVECECCICCDSARFECCDKEGGFMWNFHNLGKNPVDGKPFSFGRTCLTEEALQWREEECPCVEWQEGNLIEGTCKTDCSDP